MRRFSPTRIAFGLRGSSDANPKTAHGFRTAGTRNSNGPQIALRRAGTSASNS